MTEPKKLTLNSVFIVCNNDFCILLKNCHHISIQHNIEWKWKVITILTIVKVKICKFHIFLNYDCLWPEKVCVWPDSRFDQLWWFGRAELGCPWASIYKRLVGVGGGCRQMLINNAVKVFDREKRMEVQFLIWLKWDAIGGAIVWLNLQAG